MIDRKFLLILLTIVLMFQFCLYKTFLEDVNIYKKRIVEQYKIPDTSYIIRKGYSDTVLIKHSIPNWLK